MTKQLKKTMPVTALQRAADLARLGLTNAEIVSILTAETKIKKDKLESNKELKKVVDFGNASGVEQVASALFDAAIMGNVPAQMFYLRSKGGWRDNAKITDDQGFSHEDWVEHIARKLNEKDVGTQEVE